MASFHGCVDLCAWLSTTYVYNCDTVWSRALVTTRMTGPEAYANKRGATRCLQKGIKNLASSHDEKEQLTAYKNTSEIQEELWTTLKEAGWSHQHRKLSIHSRRTKISHQSALKARASRGRSIKCEKDRLKHVCHRKNWSIRREIITLTCFIGPEGKVERRDGKVLKLRKVRMSTQNIHRKSILT